MFAEFRVAMKTRNYAGGTRQQQQQEQQERRGGSHSEGASNRVASL